MSYEALKKYVFLKIINLEKGNHDYATTSLNEIIYIINHIYSMYHFKGLKTGFQVRLRLF